MKKIFTLILVLIFSGRLFAGIVLTEINFTQHDAISSEWSKALDLNNDGKIDVAFTSSIFFHNLTMSDSATFSTCIVVPGETPRFFNQGDSINGSLEYLGSSFKLVANDSAKMPINLTVYLGFHLFNVSTLTWHYGWLSIKLDWFHDIFYIYEAGYNDVEEMPITAGQKSLSINENFLSQVKIFQTNSGISVENLPSDFRGKLLIYDMSGRFIFRKDVSGPESFIAGIPFTGAAIVTLTNSHDRYSRKMFLTLDE